VIGLIAFDRTPRPSVCVAELTALLVKPLDTHRQGKDFAVVPQHIRFEFILLPVSDALHKLLHLTCAGRVTSQLAGIVTVMHQVWVVNPV